MADDVPGKLAGVVKYNPPSSVKEASPNGNRVNTKSGGKTPSFGKSPSDWCNVPWSKSRESDFQEWLASIDLSSPWPFLHELERSGLGVSFRMHADGEHCVTLSDGARYEAGKTNKMSGWGEDEVMALAVAYFKHKVVLDCEWDNVGAVEKEALPRR